MKKADTKFNLSIKSSGAGKIIPKVFSIKWNENVFQHISVGAFVLNDKDGKIIRNVEQYDEIKANAVNLENKNVIARFSGFIEKLSSNFEKDENTMKIKKSEVTIEARSLPSILTRNQIHGIFKFKNGYGEIVKKFASKYGFDTKGVKLVKKEGMIYFTPMTILEAFRRMAYLQDWRVFFRDHKIFFEPVKPPEDSGITITDEQMMKGGYTKF